MEKHEVVSRENWIAARRQLLAKEKEFTNGVGMKFVRVPAGKFMMGSKKEERQAVLRVERAGRRVDRLERR